MEHFCVYACENFAKDTTAFLGMPIMRAGPMCGRARFWINNGPYGLDSCILKNHLDETISRHIIGLAEKLDNLVE